MLTELRKVTRGWIAIGIVGLLALAFAIWGISDVFKPIRSNEVVSGKGVQVTQQEFSIAFENGLKNVQREAGRPVTRQEAVDANFHMQIVDSLVQQRVFDRLARAIGVGASDRMVSDEIQANPAFRSQVTGAFDATAYQSLLAQNGISRAQYEEDLRGGMTRQQLAQALVAGVRAPSGFGRMIMAFETERRVATIAGITRDLAPPPPEPTDAEIDTFYKAQGQAFALPEFRAFTLVHAEPSAFEGSVEVPEDKIRALFDFRKAQLTTPERRSFVVVSGGDEAKARQAAQRLGAGENAEAVARSLGMQAVTFTQVSKADAPDPRIGDAVFALQAGQTTAPIQGITWSAARLTGITPGVTPSLEEARPQLRAELAREEAHELMNAAVEKFEDARGGGADFETAATQAGLTVTKTGLVNARGLSPNGQPDPSVLDQPDLLKAVFEASEGDPSDWISGQDGASSMVRIDKLQPAGPPPLAQVRPQVVAAWKSEKLAAAMTAIAERVTAAVKGGADFTAAARAQRLTMVGTDTLTRRSIQSSPAPQLAAAVFTAREGDVVTGVGGPNNQVLFIAHVDKVERPDPAADPQAVERFRVAMGNPLQSDTLQTVQNAARADARVHLNQELIDSTVGKTNPDDAN